MKYIIFDKNNITKDEADVLNEHSKIGIFNTIDVSINDNTTSSEFMTLLSLYEFISKEHNNLEVYIHISARFNRYVQVLFNEIMENNNSNITIIFTAKGWSL